MSQMVTIQVESASGHDEKNLPVADAVGYLNNEIQSGNRWVYVDGIFVNNVSEGTLCSAKSVQAANPLVGGSNQ